MPSAAVVVLTQEAADNAALAQLLAARGLASISYPCIATEVLPVDLSEPIGGRLLGEYRVLVFSSKRGALGLAPAKQVLSESQPLIACVGETTKRAVEEQLGLACRIMPAGDHTADGLAQEILKRLSTPELLLHVRGDRTTGTLKRRLEAGGWQVDELVVYRNCRPDLAPLDLAGPAVAVFASPSAADNFFAANARLRANLACVAIGPVTAERLRSIGVGEVREANRPDPSSIADVIAQYIGENVANGN
jgi:uroporphyrinogen-III synthase